MASKFTEARKAFISRVVTAWWWGELCRKAGAARRRVGVKRVYIALSVSSSTIHRPAVVLIIIEDTL